MDCKRWAGQWVNGLRLAAVLLFMQAPAVQAQDAAALISGWNTSATLCTGCHSAHPLKSSGASNLQSSSGNQHNILNLFMLTPPAIASASTVNTSLRAMCGNAAHSGSLMCSSATYTNSINAIPTSPTTVSSSIYNYLFSARHGIASASAPGKTTTAANPSIGSSDTTPLAFDSIASGGTSATVWTLTLSNLRATALGFTLTSVNATEFQVVSGGSCLNAGSTTAGSVPAASTGVAGTCTFSVSYKPTGISAATRTGALTVNLAATAPNGQVVPAGEPNPRRLSFSGGVLAGTLAFVPTAIAISTPTGTPKLVEIGTITNSGSAGLNLQSLAFTTSYAVVAAPFTLPSDGCRVGTPVATGATGCKLYAVFSPAGSATSYPGSVTVADDGTNTPNTFSFIGTALQPVLTLSPTSLAFGRLAPGSTALLPVSVSNTGGAGTTLNFTGSTPFSISPTSTCTAAAGCYAIASNSCGTTLAQGAAACTVQLRYTAASAPSTTTADTARLAVASDGGAPTVIFTGATLPEPTLAVTPSTLALPLTMQFTATPVTVTNATLGTVLITNRRDAAIRYTASVTGDSADFIVTDACAPAPSVVAVGATCTLSVRFKPTATAGASTRNATLSLAFLGNGTDPAPGAQTVLLKGDATTAAVISVSGPTPAFNTVVGTPVTAVFQVSNTGTAALRLNTLAVVNITNAGEYSLATAATKNCTTGAAGDVVAGDFCNLAVRFAPANTSPATRTGTLQITHNAGSQTDVALSATATQARADLSGSALSGLPASPALAFGNVNRGSNAVQSFVITNGGTAPLNFTAFTVTGDYARSGSCAVGSALAVGASCTVSVTFTPTAAGLRSGSLAFTSDAPATPAVALNGSGVDLSEPDITPASLTVPAFASTRFDTFNATTQPLTIRNPRANAITFTSALLGSNPGDFVVAGDAACGTAPNFAIAGGATCTLSIRFKPLAAGGAGARAATLAIDFTGFNLDPSPVDKSVALSGTASAPAPVFEISSPANGRIAIQAALGRTVQGTAVIKNSGDAALTLTSVAIAATTAPTFPGDYALAAANTCTSGSTLAAGATCNVVVDFTPGAAGARPAAVAVTHNAAGSPAQIPLDGVGGQQAVISAAPSALPSFGTVSLGNSSTQTVVLSNSGVAGAPALVVTAFTLAGTARADYATSGDCTVLPKTLAQGQTCSLVLSFTPSATGQRSATLDVASSALNTLTTLALEGTGQNLQPSVSVTPATAIPATLFNTTSPTSVVVRIGNPRSNAIGYSRTLAGTNAADFSITAESCAPATVPAGGACTITLQFRPTSAPGAGTRNANLALTFTGSGSDLAPSAQTASFSGLASAPAPVFGIACGTSNPCTTLGFTAVVVGSSSATLSNSGSANLVISAYTFAGPAKDEFALAASNGCPVGATIAAGANCTLVLQFTPTTTGSRPATLSIFHNASGGSYDLALDGTATATPVPVIDTAGTTALAYGNVSLGATSTQSFTVRNTGTAALALSSIAISGAAAGDFTRSGTCTTTTPVAPAASCTVVLAFAPAAIGPRTATVTVSSNASNTPPAPTVTLSGSGVALAEPVLTPLPLDAFPLTLAGTTSAVSRVLTVTNPRANAIGYTAALAGANAAEFTLANESCATRTVAGGASCTLTLQFAPTAVGGAGTRSATLALVYAGSGSDPAPSAANVALAGSAVLPAPSFSITSTALVFAAVVGTPGTVSAVITNTGTAALALTNLGFSGVAAAEFTLAAGNTCTATSTLVPSSSCTLVLRYAPVSAGTSTAALTITHNAANSPQTVALSGTATAAPQGRIVLSALSLTFPATTVGSTAQQTVVVLNAGDAALNFSAFSFAGAAAADYIGSGTCAVGTPLAAAAQCTLVVVFKPAAVGARNAAVTVQSDASNGAATIALTGTGVAVPAPRVTLTPADVLEFGTQTVGGLYAPRKVTLANTGNASLTGLTLSVDGSGFTLAGSNVSTACPAVLAAGDSCDVQVAFAAAAAGADYSGNLRVASSAAGSPLLLPLHGRGTAALVPVLVWQPLVARLDFGPVAAGTVSATQSVTLLNQGPGGANISVLNAVGVDAAAFSVTAGNCELGTPLFQGQTCRIDIRFAPGTAGAKTASVQLASSGSAPEALALAGTGLGGPSPGLALSPTTLRFDLTRVGAQSLPAELTLSGTGSGVVRVSAIAASAGWVVQNKTCPATPFTLAAGAACTVTVTFAPQAEGAATGKLTVTTDAAPSTVEVALSGQGEAKPDLSSGGCSIASGDTATDPTLWLLVLAALVVLAVRRARRARRTGP